MTWLDLFRKAVRSWFLLFKLSLSLSLRIVLSLQYLVLYICYSWRGLWLSLSSFFSFFSCSTLRILIISSKKKPKLIIVVGRTKAVGKDGAIMIARLLFHLCEEVTRYSGSHVIVTSNRRCLPPWMIAVLWWRCFQVCPRDCWNSNVETLNVERWTSISKMDDLEEEIRHYNPQQPWQSFV